MEIFVENIGKVSLNEKSHFKTQGGEGKIYAKDDKIYKIYLDSNKLLSEKKFKELQVLNHSSIVVPKFFIKNSKSERIGFVMDWIKDTEPICKLFSNTFWNLNNIDEKHITKVVEEIKKTISFIHDKKCLIVDGNEFNYLIDNDKFLKPYFIDVDSYQTPSFKASAIMPSVKDFHSKNFSIYTDWFSFAILTCQLYLGIHPYKGTHPNFSRKDLEKRMVANVSIFNKDVSLPSTVRNFDLIPEEYKNWFVDLFEKGIRTLPPGSASINGKKISKNISFFESSDNFNIKKIKDFKEKILKVEYYNGKRIVYVKNKIYVDDKLYVVEKDTDIIFSQDETPIFVNIKDQKIVFSSIKEMFEFNLNAEKKIVIDNQLYLKNHDRLIHISFDNIGNKIVPSIKNQFSVLPNSTEIFGNVLISNVLGSYYLIIPEYTNNKSTCKMQEIKELSNYRIISAKREKDLVVVIASKNGIFDEFIIKIEKNNYIYSLEKDVENNDINFICLNSNVCIKIDKDFELKLFNSFDFQNVKIIKDQNILKIANLINLKNSVEIFSNHSIYSFSMK